MIVSLEGDEATGKTTWAFTAPKKIVGFQFDMGHRRALMGAKREWFEDAIVTTVAYNPEHPVDYSNATGDIIIWELPSPVMIDQIEIEGCIKLWNYFIIRIGEAFKDIEVRTIVVDTMTIARRIYPTWTRKRACI